MTVYRFTIWKQDMAELLRRIRLLTEQGDRELADSVLEVSAQVNRQALEELKGDDNVSEALLEIMQPLLEPLIEPFIETQIESRIETRLLLAKETATKEGMSKGIKEGRKEGIKEGIKEGRKEGREEGIKEGIQGTVDVLRELGHGDVEIRQIIQKKYHLSDEEAAEYV